MYNYVNAVLTHQKLNRRPQ